MEDNNATTLNLEWKQKKVPARTYILQNSSKIIRLCFPGGFAQSAIADIEGENWKIRKNSFPRHSIHFRHASDENDRLVVLPDWFGTSFIKKEDKRLYTWKCLNLAKGHWGWIDDNAEVLMKYKLATRSRRLKCKLHITEAGMKSDWKLMALAGWYQMVMMAEAETDKTPLKASKETESSTD